MTCSPNVPQARHATLRKIVHPTTREVLDEGLVLWFPGPHSFTGEDCCELQIHGGPAVVAAVLTALSTLPTYQHAKPGDFTKRAFYNGKLDLTSVEGLGDLIHSETEAQRRQALLQMQGSLGKLYNNWRQTLVECRANVEAYVDFGEEDHIMDVVIQEAHEKIQKLTCEVEEHLNSGVRGERVRSGVRAVILGPPNVGKSSLLNALLLRKAAIVSPLPGTTRDVIESSLDIGGYPVIISDTAGLRQTDDIVEVEGVKRAMAKAASADMVLIMVDAAEVLSMIKMNKMKSEGRYFEMKTETEDAEKENLGNIRKEESFNWDDFIIRYLADLGVLNICNENITKDKEFETTSHKGELGLVYGDEFKWLQDRNFIILINKLDLIESALDKKLLLANQSNVISCMSLETQEGFHEVVKKLQGTVKSLCDTGTGNNPILTTVRHRTHLSSCLKYLHKILKLDTHEDLGLLPLVPEQTCSSKYVTRCDAEKNINIERQYTNTYLSENSETHYESKDRSFTDYGTTHDEASLLKIAHYLQMASHHLGHITGKLTTEHILDHIFSSFCIGK
ncbi:5-taurinomethyluridine-[tRNA] synthase subunit GTPB3, mitochondrial isoform X2 [Oratosquilla oratoria]